MSLAEQPPTQVTSVHLGHGPVPVRADGHSVCFGCEPSVSDEDQGSSIALVHEEAPVSWIELWRIGRRCSGTRLQTVCERREGVAEYGFGVVGEEKRHRGRHAGTTWIHQ